VFSTALTNYCPPSLTRQLPEATPAHSVLRLAADAHAGGKPDIRPEWKRQRGQPCRTWMQQIEDDTGLNVNDAWRIAHDCKSWRALRPVASQAFHRLTDWLVDSALTCYLYSGWAFHSVLTAEAVETFSPIHVPIATRGYKNIFVALANRKRVHGSTLCSSAGCIRCAPAQNRKLSHHTASISALSCTSMYCCSNLLAYCNVTPLCIFTGQDPLGDSFSQNHYLSHIYDKRSVEGREMCGQLA